MSTNDKMKPGNEIVPIEFSDIRKIQMAIHPDRYNEWEHRAEAERLVKIVNIIQTTAEDAGKMINGKSGLTDADIGSEYYLVRINNENGMPELSPEKIRLPRKAETLLRALKLFSVKNATWEKTKESLSQQSDGAQSNENILMKEYERRGLAARSLDEIGALASEIVANIPNERSQRNLLGHLSKIIVHFLENKVSGCTSFEELSAVNTDVENFSRSAPGSLFRKVTFLDVLDSCALKIGSEMISNAKSKQDLELVLQKIAQHPFAFADLYTPTFSERKEDALAKISFVSKIRKAQTTVSIEKIRNEIQEYAFQDTTNGEAYKQTLFGYTDRKKTFIEEKIREGWLG